jgi:Methyltransferase domain
MRKTAVDHAEILEINSRLREYRRIGAAHLALCTTAAPCYSRTSRDEFDGVTEFRLAPLLSTAPSAPWPPEDLLPALGFVRETLLHPQSPACFWKHPVMAARVAFGALGNGLLPVLEKILPGGSRHCPVCEWQGRSFRAFLSADEVITDCICPGCGSFDRHRQLVLGVRAELETTRGSRSGPRMILGYSLSTALRFLLEHEGVARCFRTDIAVGEDRFAPDFVSDLRRTPFDRETFDWIFCSHVLEHIQEMDLCVNEILRMLKPGGLAWIQVPFEPGAAHSRRIEIDPHRAHAHAWQFAPDFGTLIERDGWEVTEIIAEQMLSSEERRSYGIDSRERFWLARKNS